MTLSSPVLSTHTVKLTHGWDGYHQTRINNRTPAAGAGGRERELRTDKLVRQDVSCGRQFAASTEDNDILDWTRKKRNGTDRTAQPKG